jgi:hypothetical protein
VIRNNLTLESEMRSKLVLLVGLAGIIIIGACSSSAEDKAAANNGGANTQKNTNSLPIPDGNTEVVTNGMVVPAHPGDANLASNAAPSDGIQQPGMMHKRLDKMREAGATGEKVDPAALALKSARPAPDNSTFTSYLSEAGYEIRTFNNHPQLLKVEKKTESNGNQTVKIHLRNGQVVQRPGKDIPILSTVPAATILAIAGITPPQTRAPDTGPNATKKPSSD